MPLDWEIEQPETSPKLPRAGGQPIGGGPGAGKKGQGKGLLGRYRILEEIGTGGMGIVFHAYDEVQGKDIALKSLPSEVARSSFEMEELREVFDHVSKLYHPNIATAISLDRDEGSGAAYLISELAAGENLLQYTRRQPGKRLGVKQALSILRQMAGALDYAHSLGVVHRGLKPTNVMVDGEGAVKVLDIGLSAQVQSGLGRMGKRSANATGAIPYMAPEQWRGRTPDARTDQYTMALTAYELLSGWLPFNSSSLEVLRESVLNEEPRPIEGVSRNVMQVLLRGMAKDPKARFSSCTDLVDAMESALAKGRSAIRKQLSAAGIAALFVTGLAVGFVAGRWFENRPIEVPTPNLDETVLKTDFIFDVKPVGAQLFLSQGNRVVGEYEIIEDGLELELEPGIYSAQLTHTGHRTLEQDIRVDEAHRSWQVSMTEVRGRATVRGTAGIRLQAVAADGYELELGIVTDQGVLDRELPEGDYTLIASRSAHRSLTNSVEIVSGRPLDWDVSLAPLPGRLRVNSESQGVEVWLDGQRGGKANELIDSVAVGEHQLELRQPGFRPHKRTIVVEPDSLLQLRMPALEPITGGVRVSLRNLGEAQVPTVGRIKIEGGPWREVSFPHLEEGLEVGTSTVRVEVPGYRVTVDSGLSVEIKDGEVSELQVDIEPLPGTIVLRSEPAEAVVYDAVGQKLGKAGDRIELAAFQKHQLTLRLAGYKDAVVEIDVPQPAMRLPEQTVRLEKVPVPPPPPPEVETLEPQVPNLQSPTRAPETEAVDEDASTSEEPGADGKPEKDIPGDSGNPGATKLSGEQSDG
ncbi:MAG: serine/threonine-protein kinase [Verrucomicrobiota bacterium]|nr:serine/threonine-protein kinase [Verrucomicrobiota bacterium]